MTPIDALRAPGGEGRGGASSPTKPTPGQLLKESLRGLLDAALNRAADFALEKVDQVAGSLERVAADGGPPVGALIGGVTAKIAGKNPIWGALRGAFAMMSPAVRVGILVALVLALLLLPVTLVLMLIALIVLAVVLIVRTRATA